MEKKKWDYAFGVDGAVVYQGESGTIATLPTDLVSFEANARRICRCVNSHDALVEACEGLISVIEKWNKGEKVQFGNAFGVGIDALAKAKEVI